MKLIFNHLLLLAALAIASPSAAQSILTVPLKEHGTGVILQLKDFEAEYYLVNYWAYWCVPCYKEFPELEKLSKEFGSERLKVAAITVDVVGKEKMIDEFLEKMNVSFLVLLDAEVITPPLLGVYGVPTTLLLDRQGQELERVQGFSERLLLKLRGMLRNIEDNRQ